MSKLVGLGVVAWLFLGCSVSAQVGGRAGTQPTDAEGAEPPPVCRERGRIEAPSLRDPALQQQLCEQTSTPPGAPLHDVEGHKITIQPETPRTQDRWIWVVNVDNDPSIQGAETRCVCRR